MSEVLEGEVVLHREDNGRVVVQQAPPTARMSLEVLQQSDRHVVRVSGNRIAVAGQVVYRVVGWDAHASALLLEREAAGLSNADAAAAWPAGTGNPTDFPPGAGMKGA